MTDMISLIDMKKMKKAPRAAASLLERFYDNNTIGNYELCIDEAGRGCLFGRVYIACVVLPKDPALFDGKDIRDSKKFSSKKKIREVAEYIKSHALAYNISFIDENVIDRINILQAVMRGMHMCIKETMERLSAGIEDCMAVIDGNYFTPYCLYSQKTENIVEMRHVTIEQGDAKYMGIAAASILAKTARDDYVLEMCATNPELAVKYGLDRNMGYGTKIHLDGIREHGISVWHRRTFGICKGAEVASAEEVGVGKDFT